MKLSIVVFLSLFSISIYGQSEVVQSKQKQFGFFGCESSSEANDKCAIDKLRKYFSNNFNMEELYHQDGYTKRVTLIFEIDAAGTFKILKIANHSHPNDEATIAKAKTEFEKITAKLNALTASKKGLTPALDKEGNPTVYKQMLPMNFPSEELTAEEINQKILAFETKSKDKALFAWKTDDTHYISVTQSIDSEKIKVYELDAVTKKERMVKEYNDLASMDKDYPEKSGLLQTSDYSIAFGFLDGKLIDIRKKPRVNFEVYNTETKSNAFYENLISLYNSPYKDMMLRN